MTTVPPAAGEYIAVCDPTLNAHDAEKLRQAATRIITRQSCWISDLMRNLLVSGGYAKALLQHLEQLGVVAAPDGTPSRAVLVRAEQLEEVLERIPIPEQP